MQVTETLSDGLKREFRVVVPANDLDSKVNTRLDELKDQVRINGFRPGKVPVGHLKRLYGRSVMAEAIEAAVRDANAKIVSDNNLRLAMEPQVKLPTEEDAINAVVEGKADLDYSVAMEILPKIELADVQGHQAREVSSPRWPRPRSTKRSSASPSRTARSCRKGEGAEAAIRRQGHGLVHRHDRRRAVRGRHGRGHRRR